MHCSACVSKIEQALSAVDGVLMVTVDLSSKSATITGGAQPDALIKAVKDAGYESRITEGQMEIARKQKTDSILGTKTPGNEQILQWGRDVLGMS
mgnify:CR=1 FL=1